MAKGIRWSESDLMDYKDKTKSICVSKSSYNVSDILKDLGVSDKHFKKKIKSKNTKNKEILNNIFGESNAVVDAHNKNPIKKRKGVNVSDIIETIEKSTISIKETDNSLSFWFDGARLLSVNEIFAILQIRKYELFKYKKTWHRVIKSFLQKNPVSISFNGPTKLILYRRGAKLIDLDSFQTIFKFIIDALRKEGVLAEDNPLIVVDTISKQYKGDYSVGIRLEKMAPISTSEIDNIKEQWFFN